MILFPKGYDYKKISPWSTSSDGTPILYYSYFFIDYSVLKLDLLSHDTPEMLIRLSELTGVDLEDVPIESKEVLDLFVPDENGEATMCADLPEFYSERVRKMVSKLKPASFAELVKICALSHGTGCWEENGEILVEEKGLFYIAKTLNGRNGRRILFKMERRIGSSGPANRSGMYFLKHMQFPI